uniref:Tyrosine-protein kinase receptor Tie-1 n=1 Tax=Tetraodon nigroviridis TaxID=99883 RepID=H3DL56_TETNG
ANFVPGHLTLTVNRGETVHLSMLLLGSEKRDVTWKYNGNYHYMTHWNEMVNRTAVLTLENVAIANRGIYSASYMGDTPLHGAWMRLIVRVCPNRKWGPNCDKECPACVIGYCMETVLCPPGFDGDALRDRACREGMFGRSCQQSCGSDLNCKGLRFCLPDPYGCSCASGLVWDSLFLLLLPACPNDMYGPDCKLSCKCQNGFCKRFSGCTCPTGWRGQSCEKPVPDWAPQILELEGNLEWNLNSTPKIFCSATGNPLPSHNSIELRKLDSTVLKASRTIMDSNKSTAVFEIPQLNAQQGGLWECRVSTNGGQDSRKFNLTVKEPPVPTTVPTLLEKKSKQLLVLPGDTYRGDGPILFTKILYKPEKNGNSWSSIIVYSDKKPITLMNLEPSTRYHVCVQLSRPGEGGEGAPGPETIMETDCPGSLFSFQGCPILHKIVTKIIHSAAPTMSSLPTDCFVYVVKRGHQTTNGHARDNQIKYEFSSAIYLPPMGHLKKKILTSTQKFRGSCRLFSSSCLLCVVEPTVQPEIDISSVEGRNATVRWRLPANSGVNARTASGFLVQLYGPPPHSEKLQEETTVLNVLSTRFHNLEYQRDYTVVVRLVNCGSQGPPSKPYQFRIHSQAGTAAGDNYQLLVAVVGSVTVTCVTILLALLALFFIRKMLLNRRRTFTYQSGSGEETILQFNSGTLTLTRRPKPTPEALTYPILEWEDIKFEDVIGEGNFGQVIKAMVKKDGNKMSAAIKMLKEFASENDHRDFAGELEVLCKLGQHPNIINLIGACENRGYLYIAIEYAPYGNLLDFLRKSRVLETDPAFAKEHGTASTLTSQQLLQFAVDVATGMHYLSDKQFIHRDLAARNVLVGDNLVAKIADFGLSRGEEVYVKKTMGRLPVRWMAIESLNYSVYTTKSDVWSFGVLLWEIVSLGGTPYCGMTCAELYEKLPQGFRMEKPKNCDDEVYELMKQCWRDRPYERPPFSQISVQLSRMQEARKAYVNMALFENFTYAGIDATAEEA